jgi:hypothetical protein
MTTKCANPLCTRPFLYFRSGKIYLIEVPASSNGIPLEISKKEVEYFWLCGSCAQSLHVTVDRDGSVVLEAIGGASPTDGRLPAKAATREIIRAVA